MNYYSNYADTSFDNPLNAVGANKNVIVRTSVFYSDQNVPDGFHNYTKPSNGTYLARTGYTATGNWNTKPDGSGYSVDQNTAFANGKLMAQAVGKDISGADATVNLYPEWTPNKLTVNYYSNYANQSFDNPQNAVSSNSSVLVRTIQYDYSTVVQYGLLDYSCEGDSTYLGRTGYTATGYWNTKADGSGYRVYEGEGNITGSQIAQKLGLSIANGSATVNIYPEWVANTLTINYYSNYADKSFDTPENAVSANSNVLVRTAQIDYSTVAQYGVHDYSGEGDSTYLGRTGYTATGYWNTKADGSGYRIYEGEGNITGSQIAQKLGLSIANGSATVDLYPEWTESIYTVNFTHWCYGFNGKGTNTGNDSNAVRLTTTSRTFPYTSGIAVTTDDCIDSAALPNGVECINTFSSSTFSGSWADYSFPQTFNNVAKNPLVQINYRLLDYSITYDLDGGTLAEPNPATYNVVFGATFANAPTKPGYTFAGWTINGEPVTGVNEAELDDSVFVNDAGLAGGAFYEAVKNRTIGNITVKAKWIANPPVITPVSGATIDNQTHRITGLTAGGTAAGFEQNYVTVSGGSFEYEYPTAKQVMGTGTKVKVYDVEQQLVDTYTVVIFGDVNGDSWYDGVDAYFVSLIANGLISQSNLSDAQLAACDANHDGAIDTADVALIERAGLLLNDINQNAALEELETNSVYLEYCSLIDQSIEIIEPDEPTETAEHQPAAQNVLDWFSDLFQIVLNWIYRIFHLQMA